MVSRHAPIFRRLQKIPHLEIALTENLPRESAARNKESLVRSLGDCGGKDVGIRQIADVGETALGVDQFFLGRLGGWIENDLTEGSGGRVH